MKKSLRRSFVASLILTFLFAAGIPAIILGASYGIWAVMGLGIAGTACGFYGAPISWVGYANKRGIARVVTAITEEHIYQVGEIAAHLSLSEKEVRKRLTVCFQRRFLDGYRRDGDSVILNEGVALDKKEYAAECPYCGAKYTYNADNTHCPFCGLPAVRQNPRT